MPRPMLEFDPIRHDAVIFDCDGTLVDTMPLHYCAWKCAFEQFEAPFEFTWELFQSRAGMTLEQTVEELNCEHGCNLPPSAVANVQRAEFLRRSDQIEPIGFVVDFARKVARSHPIGVASGNRSASVMRALERTGLLDCILAVVTAEDVERGKPAPDAFLLAATRLGAVPHRCLVIEDGDLGLQAASAAGMDAYRIDRDGNVAFLPRSGSTSE